MLAGYVLWLVAITVGDDLMTVSQWSLAVLLLSGALAIGAVIGGLLMRWRRKYGWSAFAFGLPVLPRGADAGRAGRPVSLSYRGLSSGISSAVIVAANPSYWVASMQNSINRGRLR